MMGRRSLWAVAGLWAALAVCAAVPALAETVRYVIDGDTVVLTDGRRVRLIGVDTPEIHDDTGRNERSARRIGVSPKKVREQARLAKKFVRQELEGRQVILEPDAAVSATGVDDYGRTLAYVYRAQDNYFVNAQVISQGHGVAFTKYPFKYAEDFKRREAEARRQKKGLWG